MASTLMKLQPNSVTQKDTTTEIALPTLYVMCGAPGSGKSTWAKRELAVKPNTVYVSRDVIRLSVITDDEHYFSHEDEVYSIFITQITKSLEEGMNVIADATHLGHSARLKLVGCLNANGMTTKQYNIIFVQMGTSVEECIERDSKREGRTHVTAPVVRRMYGYSKTPTMYEFPNVKGVWIINE